MTKLSREEVLKIAKECGLAHYVEQHVSFDERLERFAAAIYEAGAKSERAVSDRLLEALKTIAKCDEDYTEFNDVKVFATKSIAEVTAMRQERKEKPE